MAEAPLCEQPNLLVRLRVLEQADFVLALNLLGGRLPMSLTEHRRISELLNCLSEDRLHLSTSVLAKICRLMVSTSEKSNAAKTGWRC